MTAIPLSGAHRKGLAALLLAILLLSLSACGLTKPETPSPTDGPAALLGSPAQLLLVAGGREKSFSPETEDYARLMELLRERFPEQLDEAQQAITWADEHGFDREQMAAQFDYLLLTYDEPQAVGLAGLLPGAATEESLRYEALLFPLTAYPELVCADTHAFSDVVGRCFGPLGGAEDARLALLGYLDS